MSYDTILAKSPSIIYQPGGVSGGLVVTTWAEVQAFVALRQGAVIVYVDDSIVSPALVPGASGVTDFQGRGEIRPYRQDANNYSTLVIQDGATLKSLYRISSTIQVFAATTGVVPALDFDYTPNVVGTPEPLLFVDSGAFMGTTAAATDPAIVVPAGNVLQIAIVTLGGIELGSASAFISVPATATASIDLREGSGVSPGCVTGAGNLGFSADSSSLETTFSNPNGGFPPMPGVTGTYQQTQSDTRQAEIICLATTANVLSGVAGLPKIGSLRIQAEGFGGTGGGGGGEGGALGGGGGAGGGCQYSIGSFDANLANPLNVTVGAGGAAGGAGAAGHGAGGNGGDGSPSTVVDGTTAVCLAALAGSSGGQGGQAAGQGGLGGANFPQVLTGSAGAPQYPATVIGFANSGGGGSATAVAGLQGNGGYVGFGGTGGVTLFAGGAGGASAGAQGGGGGGGGAGPFQAGAVGGASTAAAGSPGADSTDNKGNGAGGGAGGTGAGDAGGAGGAGKKGWVKLSFIVP